MKEEEVKLKLTRQQKKLPSKSPALLGLTLLRTKP